MTEDEKIKLIVKTLTQSTIDNTIEWILKDSIFNSEKRHNYQYISIDGKTKFEIEIVLNDDLSSLSKWPASLHIRNANLVEGLKIVISPDLQLVIYNKYVKPNIVIKKESDTLDIILNGILDKQYSRDVKIDTLLNNDEISEKKNGIVDRIFGKK